MDDRHDFETLALDRPADAVVRVRLNRPDALNALSYPLVGELHDALDVVAADDDCKVVVLTGAGRGFCAGLDLRDFGTPPAVGAHRHRHAGVSAQGFLANLAQHLHDTPQIVIAAVNGPAFEAGSRSRRRATSASRRPAPRSARRSSAPGSPAPTSASRTSSPA